MKIINILREKLSLVRMKEIINILREKLSLVRMKKSKYFERKIVISKK